MTTYQDKQLDALGDPTRRAVLKVLRRGPMSVGDIAKQFTVSRPAISQHLRILKDAELVTDSAESTRRVYQLNREAFVSLRSYFDEFWTTALDAFNERAERKAKAKVQSKISTNTSARKRTA